MWIELGGVGVKVGVARESQSLDRITNDEDTSILGDRNRSPYPMGSHVSVSSGRRMCVAVLTPNRNGEDTGVSGHMKTSPYPIGAANVVNTGQLYTAGPNRLLITTHPDRPLRN